MKKTRRVALILDMNLPYQRKIVRGVASYARESGNWDVYVEADPLAKIPDLCKWHGHGIITTFTERRIAENLRRVNVPVVGVEGGYGWYDPKSGIPYYATDDDAIARMAADHLLSQGYTRLAYVGMPRSRYYLWSETRARSFKQRAREVKTPCSLYAGRHLSTRNWNELQLDLKEWLRSLKKPVGIMAANDARAMHVLKACFAMGIRVPEDVAVIGVDNDELMCELTEPAISSIEQGAWNVGYHAAELLNRLMSGKKVLRVVNHVPPERVVCRGSTDYLAIKDPEVAAAVRFIRKNAGEHLRVSHVLDMASVSHTTLGERFKKTMHRTIHEEIQEAKLARARQLIMAGNLALKQVAAEAGFAHVQHMTNLFRKRLGQTPSEFQRSFRLGLSEKPQ